MSLQNTVISLLLDAGAELEIEGGPYSTPLMGACAVGRLEAVKLLVRKGAKILTTITDGVLVCFMPQSTSRKSFGGCLLEGIRKVLGCSLIMQPKETWTRLFYEIMSWEQCILLR